MDIQNMKPIHLLADELSYELRIRGIVTTKKDASIKRKMLQKHLESERNRKVEFSDPLYNFEAEEKIINETIDSLKNLISEFSGPESDSGFQRIKSRLIYLTNRVRRIQIPEVDEDDKIKTFKDESYASCVELEVLLFDKIVYPPQQVPELNNAASVVNHSIINQPIVQTLTKSVPVYKWDITKFNGDYRTLLSFLVKVDELCKSRNVSKTELIDSASDLFTDKAYIWYKSVEKTVTDWDSLVKLLKRRFLVVNDFDDIIWDEIRNRTQGRHEPIHIYI